MTLATRFSKKCPKETKKMKKFYLGSFTVTTALILVLTGCGTKPISNASNSMPTSSPMASMETMSSSPSATTTTSPSAMASDQAANVYITVESGSKLGSDGKKHDAFINGDIKITQGQKVTLHFYNYDSGEHTYTSADLGLNVKVKGSTKEGEPMETTFTFTPDQVGSFAWMCTDPCDTESAQWSMTHDGFMKGHITVLPSTNKIQYISLVVNAGYKSGSDGKLHDAFTPADFTIIHGQPVELSVYNFDDGSHTFTNADLKLNLAVKGSAKDGEPALSTTTFTADKAGSFTWNCMIPCDTESTAWAMAQDGYMTGKITVN
jgi:plastocyanin